MEWNNFILHTFKIIFIILAASSLKRSGECIKKQGYLWKLKIHSIDYTLLLDMVESESIYFVSKWAFNQIWSNAHKLHHHQHSSLTWCWKLYMLCTYLSHQCFYRFSLSLFHIIYSICVYIYQTSHPLNVLLSHIRTPTVKQYIPSSLYIKFNLLH